MSIQEFLLARVDQDEAEALSGSRSAAQDFERRRAVIYRHHERSMTVMSIGKFQTVTRCSVCSGATTRPCTALRCLAQPDHGHPDYDVAWDLEAEPVG